ncbi:MAG: hypothetical protein LBV47_07890 [Bacteroidales bacterium]|jgi:uncharacterized Zn ribbon protein|nr:hypothetical protein [Bacteroidales bacterium]
MKKVVLSIIMAAFIMTTFAQGKRYGIERAVLKRNSVVEMGNTKQTVSSVQYFDDYGNRESMESFMSMAGQTLTVFTMVKDTYVYSANMATKQGTKINAAAAMDDYKMVNYLNLTDDVIKKYQIEEKGSEQFLGKECKHYELNVTLQGQNVKATVLAWHGIVLKSSIAVTGITMTEEVTEIQEGADIPKGKLELPEGIDFMEVNLPSF